MKTSYVVSAIVLVLGIFITSISAQATTITYSNTTNATGYLLYGNIMGDDLHMTRGGVLDSVSFSIYNGTGYSLSNGETVDFKIDFYNDLLSSLAGTVTFDNYVLDMGTGFKFFTFSNISDTQTITLAKDTIAVLTWSDLKSANGNHIFSGAGLGQLLYDPPTIGSSNENSLILYGSEYTVPLNAYGTGPKIPSNLYWEVGVVSQPVPEPATLLYVGCGLLGFVALRRKLRG